MSIIIYNSEVLGSTADYGGNEEEIYVYGCTEVESELDVECP